MFLFNVFFEVHINAIHFGQYIFCRFARVYKFIIALQTAKNTYWVLLIEAVFLFWNWRTLQLNFLDVKCEHKQTTYTFWYSGVGTRESGFMLLNNIHIINNHNDKYDKYISKSKIYTLWRKKKNLAFLVYNKMKMIKIILTSFSNY